jgi:hypothetical protein
MKPLVLTSWLIRDFIKSGFADLAIHFFYRFIWGPLPPTDELAAYLGARAPEQHSGTHWSAFAYGWERSRGEAHRDLALTEFCLRYDTVELWFDTRPYAQLQLIWLLHHFRACPEMRARLKLRLLDRDLVEIDTLDFDRLRRPVDVMEKNLATASTAWQAYAAPTPEACFKLIEKDLSAFPLLKPALRDLLDELPSRTTGLGATEMRMLELIAAGYANVNPLFHLRELRQTRVFDEWEQGYLLDGLAFGPKPAIAGLDEELRTIRRDNLRDRHAALLRSRMSLTDFGKAVVAHKEDFSRHNPIDRWWGGTHLTNERLWRYGPVLTKPEGW